MTEDAKRGGPERRAGQSDFDLVEDIGDPAAFDRALDDLLPRGDLGPGERFEIDPADFEAFNRELDAQMAQAKARSARVEIVEDLGTDVIAPPPARRARDTAQPVPERIGGGSDEPQVADDVVTLGTAAVAAAPGPVPAPTAAGPAPAESPAATPAPVSAATISVPPGRSATLGVLLGLGGLVAGAAGLWLGVDRQAELVHLQSVLAERPAPPAAPAVPTPSVDAERVRALEGQLAEVTRRLAELSATPTPAEPPAKAPPGDTHAPAREHAAAAPPPAPNHPSAPAVHPQAAAPAQPAPAAPKTESKPEPKPAAKEPSKAATATVDKPPAPTPAAPVAAALAPTTVATPAPEPAGDAAPAAVASAAAPAQTLPKPSGHGSWSVVIDSFKDESVAEQRSAQLGRMGLPAEVRWYIANDQMRYRVVVPGYATRDAADAAAAELRRRKAGGAWVTRLPKQD